LTDVYVGFVCEIRKVALTVIQATAGPLYYGSSIRLELVLFIKRNDHYKCPRTRKVCLSLSNRSTDIWRFISYILASYYFYYYCVLLNFMNYAQILIICNNAIWKTRNRLWEWRFLFATNEALNLILYNQSDEKLDARAHGSLNINLVYFIFFCLLMMMMMIIMMSSSIYFHSHYIFIYYYF
jgi:hypothetical protein